VRVHGRFRSNSPDAIREAVLGGRGIAVMPHWLIGDCVAKGLVREILPNYVPIPLEIHALFPERRFVPAKVLLFIDFVRSGTSNATLKNVDRPRRPPAPTK
jgi:LysR family transcriptional regulator for bpeEF and oprC